MAFPLAPVINQLQNRQHEFIKSSADTFETIATVTQSPQSMHNKILYISPSMHLWHLLIKFSFIIRCIQSACGGVHRGTLIIINLPHHIEARVALLLLKRHIALYTIKRNAQLARHFYPLNFMAAP